MKALIKYQSKTGPLYKALKGGSIVAVLGTVVSALNHDHLVVLFGDKAAAGILLFCALLSALSPSLTGILADWIYPDSDPVTEEIKAVAEATADAKL